MQNKMLLPDDFQFSQSSLQDYVDCPRRFQLRYIQRVAWPAVQVEPVDENEIHQREGNAFHRLIQQHVAGVPVERLAMQAQQSEHLSSWWESYLAYAGSDLSGLQPQGRFFAERTLATTVHGNTLVAKYDLVFTRQDGKTWIIDWKTSRKLPKRKYLVDRLQTRVYPYVLAATDGGLSQGRSLPPETIELVYWFPDFPDHPEHFAYDRVQCEEDEAYLAQLIAEIRRQGEQEMPMTSNTMRCQFCNYRSLCERGVLPGTLELWEDMAEEEPDGIVDLDFEQIAEIEF